MGNIIPESEKIKIHTQRVKILHLGNWTNKKESLRLDFIKVDMAEQELPIIEGGNYQNLQTNSKDMAKTSRKLLHG